MKRRVFLQRCVYGAGAVALVPGVLGAVGGDGGYALPDLPYGADDLAPQIDGQTMRIHHGKHHAGYTRKFNAALGAEGAAALAGLGLAAQMAALSTVGDTALQTTLRNNGGGYYNHCLFWEVMAPVGKTGTVSAALEAAIVRDFGGMEGLKAAMVAAGLGQFGSGWAWLVVRDGHLKVVGTPNQDNPLMKGLVPESDLGVPVLGVDVWEHAYYLHYQNRRAAYLDAWWQVVNWAAVSAKYAQA